MKHAEDQPVAITSEFADLQSTVAPVALQRLASQHEPRLTDTPWTDC